MRSPSKISTLALGGSRHRCGHCRLHVMAPGMPPNSQNSRWRKQKVRVRGSRNVVIWMRTLIPLAKTSANPDPIVRSLKEGPDYLPHWRFLIGEQHLSEIARAPDASAALQKILSEEKDSWIRQLLLFHSANRPSKSRAIEYALRCYRSQNENRTATQIAAMVIVDRSPRDIALEIGATSANVVAFEKLFFDVRRYLDQRFWIKELCHSPSRVTVLDEGASRWLLTACARGWNGLAFMFSTSGSNPEPIRKYELKSAGKTNSDLISLGVSGRLADFIVSLEMRGAKPTAEEMRLSCDLGLLEPGLSASFHELDYPKALSRKEEKITREAAQSVGALTPMGRRKVTALLERLQLVYPSQQFFPDPKPRKENQSKPSEAPASDPKTRGEGMSEKRSAGYVVEIKTGLFVVEIIDQKFVPLEVVGKEGAGQQLGELPAIEMSPVTLPSG